MYLYTGRLNFQNNCSILIVGLASTEFDSLGHLLQRLETPGLNSVAFSPQANYILVYGINCGGQSGTGVGFLRVLRFPLPIFIPPIAPQSPSSIIWGWYNRSVVAAVPSGLSLTPLIIIKKGIKFF
jgi:hypothetical protein